MLWYVSFFFFIYREKRQPEYFWKLQVHKSWFCNCYVILYHTQLCIVFITCWIQIYWVSFGLNWIKRSNKHPWENKKEFFYVQWVFLWSSGWRGTCRALCSWSQPNSLPAQTIGHLCRGRNSLSRCSPWPKCMGRNAGDGKDRINE